jgi:hypothetical protein
MVEPLASHSLQLLLLQNTPLTGSLLLYISLIVNVFEDLWNILHKLILAFSRQESVLSSLGFYLCGIRRDLVYKMDRTLWFGNSYLKRYFLGLFPEALSI